MNIDDMRTPGAGRVQLSDSVQMLTYVQCRASSCEGEAASAAGHGGGVGAATPCPAVPCCPRQRYSLGPAGVLYFTTSSLLVSRGPLVPHRRYEDSEDESYESLDSHGQPKPKAKTEEDQPPPIIAPSTNPERVPGGAAAIRFKKYVDNEMKRLAEERFAYLRKIEMTRCVAHVFALTHV